MQALAAHCPRSRLTDASQASLRVATPKLASRRAAVVVAAAAAAMAAAAAAAAIAAAAAGVYLLKSLS